MIQFNYDLDSTLDPDGLACRRALYWFEKECQFQFNIIGSKLECLFENNSDFEYFSKKFHFRYNDFVLREQIRSKTDSMRDLILAKMLFPSNISLEENNLQDPLDIYNERIK